ncbi:CLUMA_CG004279, isoform A [Clunio marinus]|uniref:Venom dipeptidyl peptidase 4 n=1 Tax=Clunio marinus TaxID=568069 RepID=A0A1J1HWS4_9DIPT|nr:CLUMA_CG004279, isoform A [Clunio marinus]
MISIWKILFFASVFVSSFNAKTLNSRQTNLLAVEFDQVIPPDGSSNPFSQRGFGGTWISGNEFTLTSGGLVALNIETNFNETILTSEYINGQGWRSPTFRISPDRARILVRYDQRQIFRHSTVSRFSVIVPGSTEPEFKIANGDEIQTAFFSPTGNGIAYIQDNNVYYLTTDALEVTQTITNDGVPGIIYNGVPDWVYEEEVLGGDAASWFSPNGERLAFIQFDDREVKEAIYDLYDGRQYPEEIHLRYPKVGSTNPNVILYLSNLSIGSRQALPIPTTIVTNEYVLGRVFWINDETLGAIWMNRRQNRGVLVTYDATTTVMSEIFEINEPNGWINVNTPRCDDLGRCHFINNNNNWPSIVRVDTSTKAYEYVINRNVVTLYGVTNEAVYYTAAPDDEPQNLHIYSSNDCLSCDVVGPDGNFCEYATASFSTDFSHFTMFCSGPGVQFVKIFKTEGKQELVAWEENASLRDFLQSYDLPQIKFLRMPVDGGFDASVKMQIPSHIDFDGDSTTEKYPMLVRVYAGPISVRILNTFAVGFQTYQVTKENIIYVEIDGRGTGRKGVDMMFTVNNRLGTVDVEDQIAVTKLLIERFKFIDPERVGIWGWSYGGYATAMALAKDTEMVFKCGVSVAPVTSFRFYDTIYTERYMGIDPNATNYLEGDTSTPDHIDMIGKHDFFLIHGNADDNVHYQNSMVLARALERKDIMFDQLSYPDEAHSISGSRGVQRHLYHAMDKFWKKCFKL